jgi:hypothetical protein
MKKASLFAGAAVASVALGAAPALAQGGPFADVPTDHWAYSSVDRLQREGIVIGYPDGTYGGRRAMTRYEFAVAIARLLEKIPTTTPGQELPTDLVRRSDLDTAIAGLATKEEVDQVRRLVNEFQNELTTLGVDVDAMKRRLDALENRVAFLENEMKRVKISGAVNLMARSNFRRGNSGEFLDYDGFTISTPRARTGLFGDATSTFADSRVLHDIDLDIQARLSDTATAKIKLNFGNYLPFLTSVSSFAGNRSAGAGGVSQAQEQTVYMAMVEAPVRLPGIGGVNLAAGRVPVQFTPYTLKLIDVDSYFNNDKTDLGDIPVDGVKGTFKLGPVGITALAAKVDPIKYVSNNNGELGPNQPVGYSLFAGAGFAPFTGGGFIGGSRPHQSSISPAANGAMGVENLAAIRATIGSGRFGTFGATYMGMAGRPSTGGPTGNPFDLSDFDRVFVWGADLNGQIGPLGVIASWTESVTSGRGADEFDNETFRDENNEAIDVALSYATGALSLTGGFREVDPFFAAPGYWGKLGSWTNPVDITGPYLKASYALGSGLTLAGEGHFYEGTGEAVGGLDEDDKVRNFKLGLKYGLTSASAVDLGAEWTEYDVLRVGGPIGARSKPREIFYNIGYGFSFNPSTSLKFLYQIVDYDDDATGFDTTSGDGSVAAAQFSIKF